MCISGGFLANATAFLRCRSWLRGEISNQAIPYLVKEGYAYQLFEEAHLELAKEGEEIKADQATESMAYGLFEVPR